jgi:hypothetical protein
LFYNQANFSNDNLEYIYFSRKLSSIWRRIPANLRWFNDSCCVCKHRV